MVFDIRTLLLVNFVVNILSAVTMAIIWNQYHRRFSGLSFLLASMILQMVGIGLVLLKGTIPDYFAIVLGNGLLLVGLFLLYSGIEWFVDRRSNQIHNYILLITYFVSVSYFVLVQPDLWIREMILAAMTVIIDLQICWLLFHRSPPVLHKAIRVFGVIMGFHFLFSLLILVLEIAFPFGTNDFFSAGIVGEIIVITYLLLNIWGVIALVMMVTHRLLDEIQIQEQKFTKVFHSSPYAVLLTRASDGIIFEVNEGFTRISGYKPEEAIGRTTLELSFWATGADREALISRVHEGRITDLELPLIHKSGRTLIGLLSAEEITIHGEACIMATLADITARKHAEDALRQANRQLGLLSSITKHDILNRIMVTSFYSEELLNENLDPLYTKPVQAIARATSEIRTLIEFTGQYQELGAAAPQWQQVESLFSHPDIQGLFQGISFYSDLGDLEIYADLMLRKVLYNLVENSVRHGKRVSTIRVCSHEEGEEMIIWYDDDGGGIGDAEKKMIFKKGFGKNTGLGLFLIREILLITGISIIEIGEPGVGVRFEIRVPPGKFRR